MASECPVCGFECKEDYHLAWHIANVHLQSFGRGSFAKPICWCGIAFHPPHGWPKVSKFYEHLVQEGGAAEHFLACKLGVE